MPALKIQGIAIALALLAVAASPPPAEPGGGSLWSRFVRRAKTIVHDPFGRETREPHSAKPSPRMGVAPRPIDKATQTAGGVRQASASRPIAEPARTAPGATRATAAAAKRANWFMRPKRPSRTISEYMAQEKP